MPDISSTYQLGAVNAWTNQQTFDIWIPSNAHPVGVLAQNDSYGSNWNLSLVCIQNTMALNQSTGPRRFIVTQSSGVSGESLMFIGSVQLTEPHTHSVDVAQSVINTTTEDDAVSHTHTHQIQTVPTAPMSKTLLVFEVGME